MGSNTHEHNLTTYRFDIDVDSKTIIKPEKLPKLVQGEHNSSKILFVMPKVIDGHDMSACECEIHFTNINTDTNEKAEDYCRISDMTVNGDNLEIPWSIPETATQYWGGLCFSLKFSCYDENNELVYKWNTVEFAAVPVYPSINNKKGEIIMNVPKNHYIDERVRDILAKEGLATKDYVNEQSLASAEEIVLVEADLEINGKHAELNVPLYDDDGFGLALHQQIFAEKAHAFPEYMYSYIKYTLLDADGVVVCSGYFSDGDGMLVSADKNCSSKHCGVLENVDTNEWWTSFTWELRNSNSKATVARISRLVAKQQLEDGLIPDTVVRASVTKGELLGTGETVRLDLGANGLTDIGEVLYVEYTCEDGTTFSEGFRVPPYGKIIGFGLCRDNARCEHYGDALYFSAESAGSIAVYRTQIRPIKEYLIPDTIARTTLISPSGKKFKLTVADDGTLSTTAVE